MARKAASCREGRHPRAVDRRQRLWPRERARPAHEARGRPEPRQSGAQAADRRRAPPRSRLPPSGATSQPRRPQRRRPGENARPLPPTPSISINLRARSQYSGRRWLASSRPSSRRATTRPWSSSSISEISPNGKTGPTSTGVSRLCVAPRASRPSSRAWKRWDYERRCSELALSAKASSLQPSPALGAASRRRTAPQRVAVPPRSRTRQGEARASSWPLRLDARLHAG